MFKIDKVRNLKCFGLILSSSDLRTVLTSKLLGSQEMQLEIKQVDKSTPEHVDYDPKLVNDGFHGHLRVLLGRTPGWRSQTVIFSPFRLWLATEGLEMGLSMHACNLCDFSVYLVSFWAVVEFELVSSAKMYLIFKKHAYFACRFDHLQIRLGSELSSL